MKGKKYGVGFIGFGGIAQSCHLPGWKKLNDVEVLAVADPFDIARKKAQEEFGIPMVFDDYKKLLEVDEIDIVDICAHNTFHFPATVESLKAGKHVICEKPLAVSVKEVEGMIKEAKKNNRKLMAAQHQRFRKESVSTKRMIDDGVFGEIYYAIAYALRRRGVPARPTFIKKELSGGGPMFDIGVHILDLTYWFMGCPKVHSVKGVTYTKLAKRKDIKGLWGEWDRESYDVEDFASGFIRFTDGRSISLSCSFLANMEKLEDFSTTLFGSEAGLRWPDGKLTTEKKGVLQDVEIRFDTLPDVAPHHEEIRVFLECVKKDKEVPVKPEESLEVIKMLEGIYRSAETGQEMLF
ncbi:MAG: Gfo/Idh/MocA family oxidoreductase [Candidatus Ratteibacteria bacterium]|nr:Gfo/Idh/MocA family oxidoreductase [Candidatus Ratteibacteria bacterium]